MRVGARLVAVLALTCLALAACGDDAEPAPGGSAAPLEVLTSFYPLEFVTEKVAGDRASVANLTKPGAEPHDLELTPSDVAAVADADLVVVLKGFQPAVDDAVGAQSSNNVLDVTEAARLDITSDHEEHADEQSSAHAEEEGDSHTEGGVDPHFWLDPTRLADVSDQIADRLSEVDPSGATQYAANAKALRAELQALDGELTAALERCTNRTIVTSHEAFAYLAQRYDLEQVGIAGLSPENEPDAATLAAVTDFVKKNSVSTIYYETLVSPDIAETVARETGATTAVLDPIEGLSDESAASDYVGIMRANLATLRAGQACP